MNASPTSRRTFILRIALGAAVVSSQWLFTACGSSDSGTSGTGSQATNGGNCEADGSALETTGTTDGHTHTFQLSAAQIASATPSTVFQVSNIGHTHNVQLTSQQIADLQANQAVSLETGPDSLGGDDHTHSLSISCT
jgi:hypothetical protein